MTDAVDAELAKAFISKRRGSQTAKVGSHIHTIAITALAKCWDVRTDPSSLRVGEYFGLHYSSVSKIVRLAESARRKAKEKT
jgi:hypothetical protein